ncbi:MAG: hypothetical protein GY711_34930 [bacterium]|nr:hypothetical protein [bacterium]
MPNAPWSSLQDPLPPAQTEGRTEARPARALDDESLRAIYYDLLGRPPFPAERERWMDVERHDLLDVLLGSVPFWTHWWEEQLYYFLLIDNFRPANDDARAVPGKLAEKRLSVRDALRRIAMTPTFDLRNPGADTFVTVVMEQFVGMRVQKSARELEIGKGAYDGRAGRFLGQPAASQSDVVRIAVEHKNATRYFLSREYERYVRRHPKTNQPFVRGLLVDLLGRLPTHDEVEPMRNALDGLSDSRPLRSVLVRLLLDSGDVPVPEKSSIADLFRRLLGREPADAELGAFVQTFHDPACRSTTVLYALLSNPEYHNS